MPMTGLTGSRLRERRLALGLRQADLARAAGVSASYLNLIEHNRRRIGADVLARLAEALGIGAEALSEGAGGALRDDLRAAAAEAEAGAGAAGPELDKTEDFAGRFPGWAGLLAAQHRRLGQLERAVNALNDRMTHDPHLSQALHEVLSAVSSVRSTAAILAETEDIDPVWRARFHGNLHQDSERLAVGAEALVAYLDGSEQAEEQGIAAPQEEVEAWLAVRGWQADLAAAGDLASAAARSMAGAWAERAAAEAAAMPEAAFRAAWGAGGDAAAVARQFGVGVLAVLRRAATLPGSVAGLVICDASGTLLFRKPAEGFALPRFGAACPLWPLYTALGRPGSPVRALVETEGRMPRSYLVQAFCEVEFPQGFAGPELRHAAMLIAPQDGMAAGMAGGMTGGVTGGMTGGAVPVGSTCRICARGACAARREPSILSEGV
ncbi:DUF2083 domain-containing protein [Fertoebacter nigrum]|uniref:DUF2083 domain-containing protein n=1 Tax=Fertoeibacter niger TaxID=2656921 RepID=A0A8X8GSR4_9RHOB|nr:short-chain fatty acyl-CoA regulator family protein [Fertoeibacter niger]NUB43674.1 DUF2083 domain-containing protein [Fertoeibacter niger]